MMAKKNEYKKMLTGKELKKYTVWVDGKKMTPKLVTYTEAKDTLASYELDGYKDVVITGAR